MTPRDGRRRAVLHGCGRPARGLNSPARWLFLVHRLNERRGAGRWGVMREGASAMLGVLGMLIVASRSRMAALLLLILEMRQMCA